MLSRSASAKRKLKLAQKAQKGIDAFRAAYPKFKFKEDYDYLLGDMLFDWDAIAATKYFKASIKKKAPMAKASEKALKRLELKGKESAVEFKTDKYKLVVFWSPKSSQCSSRLLEIRDFYGLYSHKVEVISACMANQEEGAKLLDKLKADWVRYKGDSDVLYNSFSCDSIPQAVLIGPNNKILMGNFKGDFKYIINKYLN